jgi:hypothetical protein
MYTVQGYNRKLWISRSSMALRRIHLLPPGYGVTFAWILGNLQIKLGRHIAKVGGPEGEPGC